MTLRRRAAKVPVTNEAPKLCPHPAVLNSLCVACGAIIKNEPKNGSSGEEISNSTQNGLLNMAGGQQLKFLNESALQEQQESKAAGLHRARKLALILDLDHTLIHTTAVECAPSDDKKEEFLKDDIHHLGIEEKVEGVGTLTKHYIVKKRPHLDDFLAQANELFQMTIYTAGTRKYAAAVADMMDPTGKLFAGRMVSRSDVPNDKFGGLEKSLARIFLGDASMAIIVDDREDVWKGEQGRQLYTVKPFVHFKGGNEVNNSAGTTTTGDKAISMRFVSDPESAKDIELDDQLPRCLEVVKEIHCDYYTEFENISTTSVPPTATPAPVSDRLVSKRRQVLHGCVVTFSGLIPVNERNPAEKCSLWKLVLSLGGQVSTEFNERTTHLVTVNVESKKVSDCMKRGDVWILHPDWLMYSGWSMAKAAEVTFSLLAPSADGKLPNPTLDPTPLLEELTRPLITLTASSSISRSGSSEDMPNAKKSGVKRSRDESSGGDSTGNGISDAEFSKDLSRSIKKRNQAWNQSQSIAETDMSDDASSSGGEGYGDDFDDLIED